MYHKSGFSLFYIRILETCKMNEIMKCKLELQMWIFPPQKFTCTVIPMKFTFTENLWHMSNLLQQLNACVSSQLFLLLPESFCSCFVLAVFRNGNLKEGQTFKNGKLLKQAMCETDLAMTLNRVCLQKFIRDYAKALQQFRIYLKSSLQQFLPSHCSSSPSTLFLRDFFQWLTPSIKCSQYFPGCHSVPVCRYLASWYQKIPISHTRYSREFYLYSKKQNVLSSLWWITSCWLFSVLTFFSQEQRNPFFLTTSSFLSSFCQILSTVFHFFLLSPCHLNNLYVIQLQFHDNLGNTKFLSWLLWEWFCYLHGCQSVPCLLFKLWV